MLKAIFNVFAIMCIVFTLFMVYVLFSDPSKENQEYSEEYYYEEAASLL